MADDVYNATLIERQDLTGQLAILRVSSDSGPVPEFEPGQFATLGLPVQAHEAAAVNPNSPRARRAGGRPRLVRRSYSIASAPDERRYLEFYIALVPQGRLTTRLWNIPVGGRLFMDTRIGGLFTLDEVPRGSDVLMVSTGTGLAPFVSMLRHYRGTNRWRRCAVLHGARFVSDLGYRDLLEQFAGEHEDIAYIPTVTREPAESDWKGQRGRVQSLFDDPAFESLAGFALDPRTCHVMLCGNPQMIDQVQARLDERHFAVCTRHHPTGTIHFERYW